MFRALLRYARGISAGAGSGDRHVGFFDSASGNVDFQEQPFRLLFDSNPVPMWLMDLSSLKFLAVNDAAVAHYGYPRETFMAMSVLDLRPPEDRHDFNDYINSGSNSQGRKLWRHRKADGDIALVSVFSGDLVYAGRAARLCAVIDVTERHEAEAKLAKQKSQIDVALNNMSQGVLLFGSDARLVFCNQRYIDMYNLSSTIVKPGCTLRQLIEHRKDVGLFSADIDQYCREVLAAVATGTTTARMFELADGRTVRAVNHPVEGGGWVATHEDISDRMRDQAQLAQEAGENKRLFETSLDLILVTNSFGNLERVSPISLAILGYAPEEMVGHNAGRFVYPEDLESTRNEMRLARSGHRTRNFETRYVHKDGHTVTLAWSGVWSQPEQKHFFTGRDVTESKAVEEKLKHLAHYDQLTGLPNRVTLHDDLQEAMGGDQRPSPRVSIALFDLDGFKNINDTLGHSVGDLLLQIVAQRMVSLQPENSRFYRLGGDEFVLLQSDSADPLKITKLVEAVLKRLADKFEIKGHQLFIGASAGIAIAPHDGADFEELLSNVDLALYDAKKAGGNVYRLFMPTLRARAQARHDLEIELRRACSNKEFELYFQPQVRASDNKIIGAEALLRWNHPARGIIPPSLFIDALGESSVVLEVGRWILCSACERAARWQALAPGLMRVGVNIFPAQFHGETLLKEVDAALKLSGLPAAMLEIEITENIALGHDEDTLAALKRLRARGVNLAFDDFGTGYASLSYLARYPLNRIKIDQSFVRGISARSTPEDTAIVRSIITMAHNLGLGVIAEGVESAEQVAFLRAEKCEELQGYYFAKAMPADEFENYLLSSEKQGAALAAG